MSASPRGAWAPTAILLIALLARLGFVLASGLDRPLEFPDENLHWQLAKNLTERGELISDDGRRAVRTPGYPLFLLPFTKLDGGVAAARLIQCALSALSAVIVYWWVREAVGRRAALVGGLLVALDPFGAFFCRLLLTEAIFTPLAMAVAWMTWRCLTRPQQPNARPISMCSLDAAMLLPLATMIRSSAVGWAVGVALMLVLSGRTLIQRTLIAATLAIFTAAAFVPWGIRNQNVIGGPAWLGSNGGATLYDGQGPNADGGSRQEHFAAELPEIAGKGELEADRILQQAALKQMQADPMRVLRLAWVKFVRMWNPIPNFSEYRSPVVAIISAAYTLPLVLLGVSAILFSRGRAALRWSLAWPLIYFTLLHMIYVGSVRYRVPLMPFLAVASVIWLAPRTGSEIDPAGAGDGSTRGERTA